MVESRENFSMYNHTGTSIRFLADSLFKHAVSYAVSSSSRDHNYIGESLLTNCKRGIPWSSSCLEYRVWELWLPSGIFNAAHLGPSLTGNSILLRYNNNIDTDLYKSMNICYGSSCLRLILKPDHQHPYTSVPYSVQAFVVCHYIFIIMCVLNTDLSGSVWYI